MEFEGIDESAWAKSRGLDPDLPPYPLLRHLLDAAAMALLLWDTYLSANQRRAIADGLACTKKQARSVVALCAGLHDIGKLSGFQFCSEHGCRHLSSHLSADRGNIGQHRHGHDVAGMHVARHVLEALGYGLPDSRRAPARKVAEIIGGHHGRFSEYDLQQVLNVIATDQHGGRAYRTQREAHAKAVFDALGSPAAPAASAPWAAVLITGVVILADWLVSQETYLRSRQRTLPMGVEDHFAQSLADAPTLIEEAGLAPVELDYPSFSEAYDINGSPNPLQQSLMNDLPGAVAAGGQEGGILLVTAAPGDGKSEAALEAARVMSRHFGTRGFSFLLPTMATSDQMYGRITGTLLRLAGPEAGLTLTHSMAWLNSAYAEDEQLEGGPEVLVCDDDAAGDAARNDMRPRLWLRGAKRALLAQFNVGTIDQALMSVLPVRHNMLRLLALSGKTFIVDEAHSYDPYMQVLLGRLLNWLGRYGAPVVLLSATLPGSVSDRLIKEYLKGAGHRTKSLKERKFPAPYPGWLYVGAGEGAPERAIRAECQRAQAEVRSMRLAVDVEPVRSGTEGAAGRLSAIEEQLAPVFGPDGGCALVVCNTVQDAQDTYEYLKERHKARRGENVEKDDHLLLHARFPAEERESQTAKVQDSMGRRGNRPTRRIIVATQVVEQSLDLDADIVISDLAPIALLLQRAGRCWRHEKWWSEHNAYPGGRGRPPWAGRPRLVVLDPLRHGGSPPHHWGDIYSEHLLQETSELLEYLGPAPVQIPEHVQNLVEQVHGDSTDFSWDDPQASERYCAHLAGESVARQQAALAVVPRAASVSGLHVLHDMEFELDEIDLATRLGAESARLVVTYTQPDGTLTFDAAGKRPVPAVDREPTTADVRTIMKRTFCVRATWVPADDPEVHVGPERWREHPMLSEVRLLKQPVVDGEAARLKVAGKTVHLDEELGFVRE